jgi:hypothetical protein
VIKGTGVQGSVTVPVVSGTGVYSGFKGTLKVADVGQRLNANIEVSASR